MKSARRKAERPTLSGARDALFRGAFEDCLAICDALPDDDVETGLLRARAYISLNRADRALDAVRRLRLRAEPTDESLTARMLEGAALLKLGQLDDGLAVLHAAHADARRAHPTIRAEISVHLGIGHYREAQYPQALHHLRSVPDDADIVHARAMLFEGWVMFDAGDVEAAAERFRAALRRIASCRQYDRFIESSALYGLAFLCAEIPKPAWWPEIRERANAFDWSTSGVVIPLFLLATAASYVAELRGDFDEAREWLSRAQAAAPSPFYEIVATVRLAELVGRYGERLSHAYFVSSALARFETLRNDALLREDHTLPLTLAEELAQGSRSRRRGAAADVLRAGRRAARARHEGRRDARRVGRADARLHRRGVGPFRARARTVPRGDGPVRRDGIPPARRGGRVPPRGADGRGTPSRVRARGGARREPRVLAERTAGEPGRPGNPAQRTAGRRAPAARRGAVQQGNRDDTRRLVVHRAQHRARTP